MPTKIKICLCFFIAWLFFISPNVHSQKITSLTRIGSVEIRKPGEIEQSPFGLGCETLDRQLWEPSEVYPFLEDLGVKWARLQTGWARCEQEKGVYTWEWLDEAVDGLIDIGIQPWFNVGYGNPLYTEGAARYHPLSSEQAFEAWKKFVIAMTRHYKDRMTYYEIWNEPNLGGFWRPDDPDPEKYVRLVAETAPLIRANDPDAVIAGGVTSRIPYDFIKACLDAGLADHIEIFSFHPYTTYPETYNDQIRALQDLLDSYKPGIELWQGENGYPSHPNSTGFSGEGPWTEMIQAKTMLRRLLLDCKLGVEMTSWFLVIDLHDYPKGSGRINYKGILRAKPEIAPKPSFKSLQVLTSLVHGEVNPRNSILYSGKEIFVEATIPDFRYGGKKNLCNLASTVLNTANGPVLAYWLEDKASDSRVFDRVSLMLEDWEGNGFKDPVLIDPLQGDIFDIDMMTIPGEGHQRKANTVQIFNTIPVSDYPLLIMEKPMMP
jgi:hypothetical protein